MTACCASRETNTVAELGGRRARKAFSAGDEVRLWVRDPSVREYALEIWNK